MDYSALLAEVRDITATAATRIEEIRAEPIRADLKGDRSPVTCADREADALLRRRLTGLLRAGWLSEETADARDRLSERLVWVVDPLDGTKEFIKGIPEYAVAVALVEEGRPILAVVHNPATGEVFSGAWALGVRKGQATAHVREGNVLLASRSELNRGEFDPFTEEPGGALPDAHSRPARWDVVGMGSIALKLAHIATGHGAVTLSRGPKHEWDVCAGVLLVEAAGGRVTDLYGKPLRFNKPVPKTRGVLAGAPGAYGRALATIEEVGASDRMAELG